MSSFLWNKLTHELIDIIEWLDNTQDTMVYRFPRYDNEIKHGAKLIVRPAQVAVFVNEGRIADVFDKPGTYTLETRNLPILATLRGWKYGFHSPFKAEVYFVSTRQFTDLKWGTKNPVMLRDAEFGMVRLRAFGTYVMRAKDAAALLEQIVGTHHRFTTADITNQLRNIITSRFASIIGESKIPVLDLAANYDELGAFVAQRIGPELDPWGLELTSLLVENISLPAEVEAAMDKRTSMGLVGDLGRFTQFQAGVAMEKAAENPGGTAGAGMGFGMGMVMANQMPAPGSSPPGSSAPGSSASGGPGTSGAGQTPPPLPSASVVVHVALDGQQAGPFDMAALQGLQQQGRLTRDTLVWMPGMAGWASAGQVSALSSLFANEPPPLPPQPPVPPSSQA